MSRLPTSKRNVPGSAVGLALVLLIAGLVPTGSLLGGGSAGVAEIVAITIDLWLHAIGYGALAVALTLTADRLSWPIVVGAVLAATGLGATVELLQWPLPWRTSSLLDGVANALGAAVGGGVAGVVRIVRRW